MGNADACKLTFFVKFNSSENLYSSEPMGYDSRRKKKERKEEMQNNTRLHGPSYAMPICSSNTDEEFREGRRMQMT